MKKSSSRGRSLVCSTCMRGRYCSFRSSDEDETFLWQFFSCLIRMLLSDWIDSRFNLQTQKQSTSVRHLLRLDQRRLKHNKSFFRIQMKIFSLWGVFLITFCCQNASVHQKLDILTSSTVTSPSELRFITATSGCHWYLKPKMFSWTLCSTENHRELERVESVYPAAFSQISRSSGRFRRSGWFCSASCQSHRAS